MQFQLYKLQEEPTGGKEIYKYITVIQSRIIFISQLKSGMHAF